MCIQIKDSIIIKGQKYFLYTFPLDSYWTKKNPKPQTRLINTNCWRGYVATWEIFQKSLYLVDIKYFSPGGDFGLDYIFPNSTGKVKADWFTGELKIPIGNVLFQEHMADPVYDSDWYICIKKSYVISQRLKANY